jgi:hypothetical protein
MAPASSFRKLRSVKSNSTVIMSTKNGNKLSQIIEIFPEGVLLVHFDAETKQPFVHFCNEAMKVLL